jgi:hypothetical protein
MFSCQCNAEVYIVYGRLLFFFKMSDTVFGILYEWNFIKFNRKTDKCFLRWYDVPIEKRNYLFSPFTSCPEHITLWSRILGKLVVAKLIKKWKTDVRCHIHKKLQFSPILRQLNSAHPILACISQTVFHPQVFPRKFCVHSSSSAYVLTTCTAHLVFHYLVSLVVFAEEHRL